MSDLSIRSMETALSQHTRAVQQDNWQVLAGISTTQFTVSLINPAGTATHPVVPNALDGSSYVGCEIEFTSGVNSGETAGVATATGRVSAPILSVISVGNPVVTTVTLSAALPVVPAAGDSFTIYRVPANVTVNAPENLAQVGGQNVPTPGGIAAVPITNAPQSIASVAPGAIAANGTLLTAAYTVPANGSIVLAVTLAVAAVSSVLQVTRNNGTFYGNLNNGVALSAQDEFDANIPVKSGDIVQFALVTATTLGQAEFAFVAQQ